MFDAKILAAVLATLGAMTATMGGGSVQTAELGERVSGAGIGISGLMENPIEALRSAFMNEPEPTNSVRATLELEEFESQQFKLKDAKLKPENLENFKMGRKSVSTEEEVLFEGFTGSLDPGNVTELNGKVQGFQSRNLNISGGFQLNEEVNSSEITAEGIDKVGLKFKSVTGRIESQKTSTVIETGTSININSFSGDIWTYPFNRTVIMVGKVDRLESDRFSFGN